VQVCDLSVRTALTLVLVVSFAACLFGQTATSADQIAADAAPSLAVVLAGRNSNQVPSAVGVAIAIRSSGVLLTPYHLIKDARSLQVRIKTGEVFDQVQLLGVDTRRDVAAIKVTGTLAALPVRTAAEMRAGAAVVVVSSVASPQLSVSAGLVAAYRMADEVAGAGSGYRLIQLTAPVAVGSSGGVLLDSGGNALGLIVGSQTNGPTTDFAVPIDSVLGLGDAAVAKTFANGSKLKLQPGLQLQAGLRTPAAASNASGQPAPPPKAPQPQPKPKNDRQAILHNMQTIYIDADNAKQFGSNDMKAALESNRAFPSLQLRVVDDPKAADAVLVIRQAALWEFPFELRSPDRTTLLLFGASRAYEGKTATANIAIDFIRLTRSNRNK
jgi:S1-C subfamily serine protease